MKILLTRPKVDSLETSRLLEKIKIGTEILPFLKIREFSYVVPKLQQIDIIIFTSKNAVKFFKFDKKFREKMVFSVGFETKNLLKKNGYKNIKNTTQTLDKLLITIKRFLSKGKVIIHPTFKKKREDLKKFFLNYNCEYNSIKCYSSQMVKPDLKQFFSFMKNIHNTIVTFYSSMTARAFTNFVLEKNLKEFCKKKIFIVISDKVKNELLTLGKLSIYVSETPDQKNMINLIRYHYFKEKKIG